MMECTAAGFLQEVLCWLRLQSTLLRFRVFACLLRVSSALQTTQWGWLLTSTAYLQLQLDNRPCHSAQTVVVVSENQLKVGDFGQIHVCKF